MVPVPLVRADTGRRDSVIGSMRPVAEPVLEVVAASVGAIDRDRIETVGGGSINRSFLLVTLRGARYLLKTNIKSALAMFEAERAALDELRSANAVRVPQAVHVSVAGDVSFLLLEYIELGRKTAAAAAACGRALALLHQQVRPRFGWHRDNTIGSTRQINDWSTDWVAFFRDARLGYQFRLAADNGIGESIGAAGWRLLDRLPELFEGHAPAASLLHGDLWGGNWGATYGEEPVIFDPATYYGDRETDIAMTMLFGGFDRAFYAAYEETWPLDDGFNRRCDLYNLYHVLNHFNLFGGGYRYQASELLDRLLA